MNMGSAGIGIGAGAQKYQLVFLFENKDRFDRFVNSGWTASANANAVAGKSGANAQTSFQDGMAFYQITEAGLMLQADISGTKFWRDDELNKSHEATD
jgi:lipid-binding SYLF domain-containing protein